MKLRPPPLGRYAECARRCLCVASPRSNLEQAEPTAAFRRVTRVPSVTSVPLTMVVRLVMGVRLRHGGRAASLRFAVPWPVAGARTVMAARPAGCQLSATGGAQVLDDVFHAAREVVDRVRDLIHIAARFVGDR